MSRDKRKMKKEELSDKNTSEWIKFFNTKFSEHRKNKAMLLYTWYLGDSDMLTEAYVNLAKTDWDNSVRDNRNSKTYFWNVASQEADVKRTHSGLAKAIIKTLINILDYPSAKVMTNSVNKETNELEQAEDEKNEERLESILEDNDFENLTKQQQEPLTWCMGDGVFLVNNVPEISDKPIISFVDARNTAYDIKANRIVKVYTRSYYMQNNTNYCLLEERGTMTYEGAKTAYIKSNLFKLANNETRYIACEVDLSTIDELKDVKPLVAIKGLDEMLAVPCVYDYEPVSERGTGLFNEKMDLLDDLDQCLSQDANCIRLSTPVETIDENILETDDDGKVIEPKRYDRRFLKVKTSVNSVGENGSGIVSSVPQIDFSRYSNEALSITSTILTGIISPCTIGADVSKKDNAEAQREKEKQTMFTRNALIALQTITFKKLFNLVLKFDDVIHNNKAQNYDITIDYEEYGNPTFDAKLQSLYPAFVAGGLSPEQYVKELWGDSLTDDEKETEIAYLTKQRQSGMSITEDDPFASMMDEA